MPGPIIFPAVGWARTTNVGYQSQTYNPLKIYALDDDSCLFFVSSNGTQHGFDAYVIDGTSLATTHYRTVYNPNQPNITKIIAFGGGFFNAVMDDGSSYSFQAANLKLNNSSPILIPQNTLPIPASMCGANLTKLFYDATDSTLAVGYYNALNGSIFAATYKALKGGLQFIGSGFPGFWSVGVDPWDQTGSPAGSSAQILSNGQTSSYSANPFIVYRQQFKIYPGVPQNNCYLSTAFFPNVAACTATGYTVVSIDPDTGVVTGRVETPNNALVSSSLSTGFNTGVTVVGGPPAYPCDTNIPGLVAYMLPEPQQYYYGLHVFGDNGIWFNLPFLYAGAASCAVTRKHIFVCIFYQGTTIGVIDAPNYFYNAYSATKQARVLVNNSRPISVTGAFKA
jgi:hypothetical protein